MNLDKLAIKHGTDKSSLYHNYTEIYENIFKGVCAKKVLEIGIEQGASLKMWRDYFLDAVIYGIDNNPEHLFTEDRIITKLADQGSELSLVTLGKDVGGNIDIIIDDGSHYPEDQFKTLTYLFPFLSFGGYYIIEDVWAVGELISNLKNYHYTIIKTKESKEKDDSYLFIIKKAL